MNVFDYDQPLWKHRPSHTFGVSGANYGTGSESRAGRTSTWGGANPAGSRSVHASAPCAGVIRARLIRARRWARAVPAAGVRLPGLSPGAVRAADRGRDQRFERVAAFARVERTILGRAAVVSLQ